MKKIAIDARELRTSTGRYIERLLHYLQQVDANHKYIVLLKPADIDGWKPTNKNFSVVPCPYKEFTFAEQYGMLRQLTEMGVDLVHFGMVQQPILYMGKAVTTMHDLTTVKFRNPSKNWLVFTLKREVYKWVNRIAARKSRVVIAISEYSKDTVAKFAHINSRKIVVTLEAADKIQDEPEPPVDGSHNDEKFIMYVGRPTPHKNLERLIEAFVMLRQTHPDLKLVLAGKKDANYKRIERSVKAAGIAGVTFTDFISEGQLRWLYEHTAAYVFPSLSEGFGLPGLEAMMHGAPVVSSDATCLPEIYGDAAEYFNPLDSFDMASAVARVIDNPKHTTKLRELGYAQSRKYSWKRMAEQTLAVYNGVLGE
jgi:glycosyltransferase involved in cell wall biosynthesis